MNPQVAGSQLVRLKSISVLWLRTTTEALRLLRFAIRWTLVLIFFFA